jgi:hypothetical protein
MAPTSLRLPNIQMLMKRLNDGGQQQHQNYMHHHDPSSNNIACGEELAAMEMEIMDRGHHELLEGGGIGHLNGLSTNFFRRKCWK